MPYQPEHAVAWTEIPVSDLAAAVAFYNEVFDYGLSIEDGGPNEVAMGPSNGVGFHLYPGKPAAGGNGPTVHLAVQGRLEDTADRWRKAGGKVLCDPTTIPPGRFVYCTDPDGNSIGLFEPAKA